MVSLSLDGTSFMKEKSTHKQIFYSDEWGWAEIFKVPQYPDRVFLRAGFFKKATTSKNYKTILSLYYDVLSFLQEKGLKEIYCYVDNQQSFDFNQRAGFVPTFEILPDKGIEFMKRVL